MNSNHTVHARILEAINQGEDLAELLNGLFRTHDKCQNLLAPALYMLSHCYQAARDAGQAERQADPAIVEFMSGSLERILFDLNVSVNTDPSLVSRQLSAMVISINAYRQAGFRWTAPVVSPAPVPVSVVEMPVFVTTTEVKRNPKTLEITGSVATQKYATH